jgi:uncharacterized protein YjbI with pentapeptide repeats
VKKLESVNYVGDDLLGADFSDTDLRAADFTDACLIGAKFRRSTFGLSRLSLVAFVVVSLAIAGLAATAVSAGAEAMRDGVRGSDSDQFVAVLSLAIFIGFVGVTVFRGLGTGIYMAVVTHLGIADFRGASLGGAMFDGATFTSGALFDPSSHPASEAPAETDQEV